VSTLLFHFVSKEIMREGRKE